ncbi:hypothetical protein TL18_06300 [Methanobrevibacter sp. YE315]|nr:hypothetical protein TL18_06300 [Methanobrevibacter sp. YE315]
MSAAIVFIDSSVDNINKTMPEISDLIEKGDNAYNDAVELVNNKNYDESMSKAISAGNSYNASLYNLQVIKSNYSSDINDVQNRYIDIVIKELELKINAADKLKEAIDCFKVNSNSTGTSYASEANDLIFEASNYQNERDTIVKENPKVFKQDSII